MAARGSGSIQLEDAPANEPAADPPTDSRPDSATSGTGCAPSRSHWRIPLRAHPAWVVIVMAAALLWRVAMNTGLNTDAFWALASGQWMLAHHAVIRTDVFSYTIHGRNWVAEEWGFELLLAWMVRNIGPITYWLVSAGTCTAALAFGVIRWRRLGAGWLWVAVLAVVAAVPLCFGVSPRPQDLSYAFFALELLLLTLARKRRAWLLALPLLMCVWANFHGSFLMGLGVLGLEVLWSLLPASTRRLRVMGHLPTRAALVTLVGGIAAALVNPRGIRLFSYAIHVSFAPQLASMIAEWQSPNFHSLLLLAAIIGPAIALVFMLGRSESPVALEDLVIWLALFLATLHAVRFFPYLGIAWCGMAARWRPTGREAIRPSLLTWPLGGLVAFAVLSGAQVPAGAVQTGSGELGNPVAAGHFLVGQKGRVFSTYTWNDYLISLKIPVFVDGRTDLYFGTPILTEYNSVANVEANPDTILNEWNVRWVLWDTGTPLAVYLSHDPIWHEVYHSGNSLVFERVGAQNSSSAAKTSQILPSTSVSTVPERSTNRS